MSIRILLLLIISVVLTTNAYKDDVEEIKMEKRSGPVIVKAPPHLQKIFKHLKKEAGWKSTGARLYINQSSTEVNAITWGDGSIVLHQGAINFYGKNMDQAAWVMAHELGHWVMGHVGLNHEACQRTSKAHRQCEMDADLYANKLLKKAGYDHCAGGRLWKRMLDAFGNLGGDSHPTFLQRYNYLRCR